MNSVTLRKYAMFLENNFDISIDPQALAFIASEDSSVLGLLGESINRRATMQHRAGYYDGHGHDHHDSYFKQIVVPCVYLPFDENGSRIPHVQIFMEKVEEISAKHPNLQISEGEKRNECPFVKIRYIDDFAVPAESDTMAAGRDMTGELPLSQEFSDYNMPVITKQCSHAALPQDYVGGQGYRSNGG
jgi:hypothetical protein